jgi:hypothetical protein
MKSWNGHWNGTAGVPSGTDLERGTAQTRASTGLPLERTVERSPYSHSGTFHPSLRDGTVERAERNAAERGVFAAMADQLLTAPLSSSYAPSFLRRGTAQGAVTAGLPRQSSWLARTAR